MLAKILNFFLPRTVNKNKLKNSLLKVWQDGQQWAYQFCDYELLCMYDNTDTIRKYTEKQVVEAVQQLGHTVVDFEGVLYFSSVKLSEEELYQACKKAQQEGVLYD